MNLTISPKLNSGYSAMPNQNANKSKAKASQNIAFGDSFGMIKPEAMHLKDFIFQEIKKNGFKIAKEEESVLTPEIVEKHYAGLKSAAQEKLKAGKDFLMKIYNDVFKNMQKGPVNKFIIEGDEAEVARFKKFVGATQYQKRDPQSLRGLVEAKEVERLRTSGASEEEITKFRDEFTFIHASDTDVFDPENTINPIKNYDREIDLHFPGYRK